VCARAPVSCIVLLCTPPKAGGEKVRELLIEKGLGGLRGGFGQCVQACEARGYSIETLGRLAVPPNNDNLYQICLLIEGWPADWKIWVWTGVGFMWR